ncbi:MAG: manganese efflux pump MntP family protein [Spirochaetia bacterium]|nr:manganese efflux pump MntP family protein [Spirochaetia bacterium]
MLFLFNSILLGTGLAMDAFSVSMVNGLKESEMPLHKMNLIAGVYAFFQFAMPMTGWICVHTILTYFKKFETFIPWIALILLLYIGGKMLIEGIRKTEEDTADNSALTFSTLIIQGIATSIDALSVGFTIANYALLMAVICSLIIAAVTYIISITGIVIGKKVGTKLSSKAAVLGGVILIAIGIEIFIKGIFF